MHLTLPDACNRLVCSRWLILLLVLLPVLLLSACASRSPLDEPRPAGHQAFFQTDGRSSFADIARRHGIGEAELRRYNPRTQQNPPATGQRLRIPERNSDVLANGPYYYRIQSGDTLSVLAQHFHISLISLIQANPGIDPDRLRIGQRVVIPVNGRDTLNYRWPVDNPQVRINFSWQRWGMHQGLALETRARQEVFPIAPGRVVFAGEMRGFGRVVIIEHGQGRQSVYAYCHALFVDQGSRLSGRHPVCAAGSQRQIEKPGIYFELRENGQPVPPENYLPALPWARG
ncbi:peptidoglycan DD-metalloendopeptidase family protein [Marinospirillum alkaliphilum]|uniref:peptidoglycan DD-metalloendopeptidase family protein n=1 Tax=Marinospirillum alkaliphilum TaxID=148454 RepID=UPI0015A534F3|nr:peptidoglycan DD-metalloendopeptidase family protein [Marinospirillum alkaliphilum]